MAFRDDSGRKVPTLRRTVVLTLSFATAKKRARLRALEEAFRGHVNATIRFLWPRPAATLNEARARPGGRLSSALRREAARLAFGLVQATRKAEEATGAKASRPRYRGGLRLSDPNLVDVSLREGAPDLPDGRPLDVLVALSTPRKGDRLRVPTRATRVLRKWLALPGARLAQCLEVRGDRLAVVVEAPRPTKREVGAVLGVDVGLSTLLATSRGELLGTDFAAVAAKVRRRKPGSRGRLRARRARDHAVGEALNRLPWEPDPALGWPGVRALALENLKGIKRGPKGSRAQRRRLAPWTARAVRERAGHKAEERGAWILDVRAAGNSTTCPECGVSLRESRRGRTFLCAYCGHLSDADVVGATNAARRGVEGLPRVEAAVAKRAAEKEAKKAAAASAAAASKAPAPGPEGPGTAPASTSGRAADASGGPRPSGRRTAPAKARRERGGRPAGAGDKVRKRVSTSGPPGRVGSPGPKNASERVTRHGF